MQVLDTGTDPESGTVYTGMELLRGEDILPWLGGRHVVMGFAARGQPLSDARPVLPEVVEVGSGSAKGRGSVWC